MNTYCNINETMLSEVYGGNSGGAAVVAALGCAAGGLCHNNDRCLKR